MPETTFCKKTFLTTCQILYKPVRPDKTARTLMIGREKYKQTLRNIVTLFRTYGVNIFIDYCPAAAIQRKVKRVERDIGLITGMVSAAV
jgi:hypothetical protein